MADVGIACSLHEEFGLVAIEMMMNKLPIIVSDVGGLDEIVENEFSGLKSHVKNKKNKRFLSPHLSVQQIILDSHLCLFYIFFLIVLFHKSMSYDIYPIMHYIGQDFSHRLFGLFF